MRSACLVYLTSCLRICYHACWSLVPEIVAYVKSKYWTCRYLFKLEGILTMIVSSQFSSMYPSEEQVWVIPLCQKITVHEIILDLYKNIQ